MKHSELLNLVSSYGEDLIKDMLTNHSRNWVYDKLKIGEKNYYNLIKKFNIKPINIPYSWYNNGTDNIMVFDDCPIPLGYEKGRLISIGGTKDYFWITNGTINRLINKQTKIPDGFHKGTSSSSTKGYIWVNNGTVSLLVPKDEIPDGFDFKGKVDTTKYKLAASKRKKKWCNNGVDELYINFYDEIPNGYTEGRLPKLTLQDKIKKRDNEFSSLGFIAIKDLTTKQRTAYQYYRDKYKFDFHPVSKKDTYTYIDKKYLKMLDEYSQENHSYGVSNKELDVYNYIKSIYDGEIIQHCKNILKSSKHNYYEMDIYLPDKKLGIEFNGNYWHCDLIKDKYYHYNKYKLAEDLGIRLIHIYEYEWDDILTKEKLKSFIKKLIIRDDEHNIYAKNCEIKQITNKDAKKLNDAVHLQNHRNAQVTYGLFYKDELVQLMSFSKSRYNRNLKEENSWEIIRSCSSRNVIGGVSKLFTHFIDDYKPQTVFSYCDFNKFNGRSYELIGMKCIGYSKFDMKWLLSCNVVVNRQPSKHKELKEQAIAKIFGSGSKKYLWESEQL